MDPDDEIPVQRDSCRIHDARTVSLSVELVPVFARASEFVALDTIDSRYCCTYSCIHDSSIAFAVRATGFRIVRSSTWFAPSLGPETRNIVAIGGEDEQNRVALGAAIVKNSAPILGP